MQDWKLIILWLIFVTTLFTSVRIVEMSQYGENLEKYNHTRPIFR